MQQLVLPIDDIDLHKGEFFVTKCNKEAYDVLFSDIATLNRILLIGLTFSGKTRLGKIWLEHNLNLYIDCKRSIQDIIIPSTCKKIVFDNIEYAEEIYLLHLVNKCMNDYISIVMIASVKKTFKIPDLQSRINATYHVTITPPDQEFITLMIQEMCFFNKIKISNSTMIYIRNNIFFKDFLNFTGFKLDLQRLYSTKKLLNIDTVKIAYDNWNRV